MRSVGHIWAIIVNLITLFIELSIFNQAYSSFDKIVFALLVMCYIQISYFMSTWGKGQMEVMFALSHDFIHLRKELGNNKNKDAIEIDEEDLKESVKNTKYIHIRYWINMGFMSIFSIIALYNLLIAL